MADSSRLETAFRLRAALWGFLVTLGLMGGGVAFMRCVVNSGQHETERLATIEPPSADFGRIRQFQTVRHDFLLLNNSRDDMRIVGVHTTCSCTAAAEDIVGKLIPAHGTLTIPISYESGDRHGPASAVATVLLDMGGTTYEARAELRGEIEPEFVIEPEHLVFGSVSPGAESARVVTLRAARDRTIRITTARCNQPEFQVSIARNGQTDGGHPASNTATAVVSFHAPELAQRRSISGIVNLTTSSEQVPTASVLVSALVAPEVSIHPAVLVRAPDATTLRDALLTIRTTSPSHVIQLIAETSEGVAELPLSSHVQGPLDVWRPTHRINVPAALLRAARQIDIRLNVCKETGRVEARSVSVEVKSLVNHEMEVDQ